MAAEVFYKNVSNRASTTINRSISKKPSEEVRSIISSFGAKVISDPNQILALTNSYSKNLDLKWGIGESLKKIKEWNQAIDRRALSTIIGNDKISALLKEVIAETQIHGSSDSKYRYQRP